MRFLALSSTALACAAAAALAMPARAQTYPPPTQLPPPPAPYGAPTSAIPPPAGYGAASPGYSATSVPAPPPAYYAPGMPAYQPPASPPPAASYSQSTPPGVNPATGARPGHEPGIGVSYPVSTKASNIDRMDARSEIAPTLPTPALPPGSGPEAYLQAARASLAAGRTGEAQQALEMAQTRLLDRSVPYNAVNTPSANPAVAQISDALHALAAGDRARAMQIIDATIPLASR